MEEKPHIKKRGANSGEVKRCVPRARSKPAKNCEPGWQSDSSCGVESGISYRGRYKAVESPRVPWGVLGSVPFRPPP